NEHVPQVLSSAALGSDAGRDARPRVAEVVHRDAVLLLEQLGQASTSVITDRADDGDSSLSLGPCQDAVPLARGGVESRRGRRWRRAGRGTGGEEDPE